MATLQFDQLAKRVQALGLELIEDDDDGSANGPGIYVLDPKQHKLVWLGTEGGQTALDNLEPWVADREAAAGDSNVTRIAAIAQNAADRMEAIADEQGDDERFLSLIVCACPRDRFKAMDVRKSDGIKAAIKFIGQCTISDEEYEPGEREPIPHNRLSGGSAWDDCTLELERVNGMVNALHAQIMGGGVAVGSELAPLVTPIILLDLELDYLYTAINALESGWTDPEDAETAKGGAA